MAQLFVNRLSAIDFSYLHSTRGLVGESWLVDVVLHGGLDEQGMVLDFAQVKKRIKQIIDHHFDHKLLVAADYPGLQRHADGQQLHLAYRLQNGTELHHQSPGQAVTLIPGVEITAQNTAQAIRQMIMPQMPPNVSDIQLSLSTEHIIGAYYQYSHGLKHHAGNCQRIAHGHRSRLRIERNGQPDQTLAQHWAKRWQDIYIGSREDVYAEKEGCLLFGYASSQGDFELYIPRQSCYLIDADSTVENIAQHIAGQLHQDYPQDSFRVLAYEGVDKGAIGIV